MKFISKISKMGEDYFIRIPRDVRDKCFEKGELSTIKTRDFVFVTVQETLE